MTALSAPVKPAQDPLGPVVERALLGDESARDRLARDVEQIVRHVVARRFGLRDHDLEDAVQESLLRVFRALHRFEPDRAKLSTWSATIAVNYCRDRLRRRRDMSSLDAFAEHGGVIESEEREPSVDAEFAELEGEYKRRLTALGAPIRDVLRLRAEQGLSYDQIADQLSIASGTVRSRLHRARRAIAPLIEPAAA